MSVLALMLGVALGGAPSAPVAAPESGLIDHARDSLVAASDTTVQLRFEIPARPLGDALSEFSRQSGLRVRVDRESASGKFSSSVSGVYTPSEALRRLLSGTGLAADFRSGGSEVLIRGVSNDVAVYTLSPLTVIGSSARGYSPLRSSSGTRVDTPLRDTPLSVSVITSELIRDQGMHGLAEVVDYVPGITMGHGEGHRDAPTIRGVSTTANFFVDGVRDDAQYYRDLYNVERVEALKGANALAFGRGGGGGVINRVNKVAQWAPNRQLVLEGGSWDQKRVALDIGQGFGPGFAARFNGVYEESGGFRDEGEVRRYGLNPTAAISIGPRTILHLGYEHLDDDRLVDRGIPSFDGGPSPAPVGRFFGNPDLNRATMVLHSGSASLEHTRASGLTVRSRFHFADYEKFYQNTLPGGMNDLGTMVRLTAYNNAVDRRNFFNQTDLIYEVNTGSLAHTLLAGLEVGYQETSVFRRTGYFNDTDASTEVPFESPRVSTPVVFRQSATDANNRTIARVASAYLQNQIEITRRWQAVAGIRLDRFDIDYRNRRSGAELNRTDAVISPRLGLVFKPFEPVSLYGSYGVTHLPSAGDQFASLTATTETLEPERFTNQELGLKWELRPDLILTGAAYRLERTNTAAPDPADPSRLVQTGRQRTEGIEIEGSGRITDAWQVVGGLALQRAEIVNETSAAPAGTKVHLVPERTFSLWNRYQLLEPVGIGLGVVHQSKMFAAIDNSVTLPGYTRVDGAVFLRLGERLSAQVNLENILDEKYYPTSHGNNNIMPGAPRSLRITLRAGH